jgi:conjugal transfer pilus assembly protein TraF
MKIESSVFSEAGNSSLLWKIMIFLLVAGFASSSLANNKFFDQRYRGWMWFEESTQEEEVRGEPEALTTPPTLEQMQQAKRENEEFAEELSLLKHLAVRHPNNLEYIKLYKMKEKEMMNNAQTLGLNWLMVNFLNPEILDELENPQNIYGRDIKGKKKRGDERSILQDLTKKIEIFVFRQDGCPYCPTLEKHLKTFATKYGFKVEAISPDMSQSNYFKTNSSPELIEALGLEVMPAVIAVVNDTRQRFELGRGAVSVVEFEEKGILLSEYLENQALKLKQLENQKHIMNTRGR